MPDKNLPFPQGWNPCLAGEGKHGSLDGRGVTMMPHWWGVIEINLLACQGKHFKEKCLFKEIVWRTTWEKGQGKLLRAAGDPGGTPCQRSASVGGDAWALGVRPARTGKSGSKTLFLLYVSSEPSIEKASVSTGKKKFNGSRSISTEQIKGSIWSREVINQ